MQPHQRVKLYLLASGLFDEPDAEKSDFHFSLIAHLLRNAPADWLYADILRALEQDLVSGVDENALGEEYRRLFTGLDDGRVPPYSEYWLPVAAARQLKASPCATFLDSSEDSGHLIAQLEFMAFLVADDENTRALQHHFLSQGLVRWVPRFAQTVMSETHSPHYHLAAGFLIRLMAAEHRFLQQHADTELLVAA